MATVGTKIMIIGSGGCGKTTLAKALGSVTNLSVIHLDKHFWNSGWVATPREEWRKKQQALFASDSWIADGNYTGTLALRLERADTILFLNLPRGLRIYRVIKRWLQNIGKNRDDMPEGCPEKIDFTFLLWIWNYKKDTWPGMQEKIIASKKECIILKSRKDIKRFLASQIPESEKEKII